MTVSDEAPARDADALPVPETLLVPLLDDAAAVLRDLDPGDFPAAVRPLAAFGRQGLTTGPARQQLRRALEVDGTFRSRAVERFRHRPEVVAVLESWDPLDALRRAEDASERADLPLLASALYAERPAGWSFGLGVICAVFDRKRLDKEAHDDAKARQLQLGTLDEARRRAEEIRDRARHDVARLEEQLRTERRARREREGKAERELDDAKRQRREADAVLEKAQADVSAAEARLARESTRAREAERQVRELRRQLVDLTPADGALPPTAAALGEAAADARRLTATLEGFAATTPIPPAPAAEPTADVPTRRPRPSPPPGLDVSTAAAIDAMLRTRGIRLVVDGYNLTMRAWKGAAPADQRERLLTALERLHLRLRCDVVAVFDGSDVTAPPPRRRPGVRVVFSAADEEADPVVIRQIDTAPSTVPILVASSDGWVRDHAEAAGAVVVTADALLELLRR